MKKIIETVEKYIKDLCTILKIEQPTISFDASKFPTSTTMAMCSSDGLTIYLRQSDKLTPDLFFATAHELRHIWQIRTDYEFYLEDYKASDSLSIEEYNLQISEIDANAFAGIVLTDFFKLQPLYKGMSASVISAIKAQENEIIESL